MRLLIGIPWKGLKENTEDTEVMGTVQGRSGVRHGEYTPFIISRC